MIINFYREIKGYEFIKEMKNKHGTMKKLENKIKKEQNPLDMVDLENWKIFEKDPDETLKELITRFVDKVHTVTIDFELIETIKKEKPESINELVNITKDNIYDMNQKLDYLEANGLIELDNNKPVVNYDKIEIAI